MLKIYRLYFYRKHIAPDLWKNEWGHEIYFSNRSNHSGGVCILFSQKLNYSIEETIADTNGRYILVKVKILGEEYILCNIYAPNKDDPLFFNSLFEQLENFADSRLIIGGDFNLVQDINLDKIGGRKNTNI